MSNEAITWASKLHPGKGPKGVLFCLADKATDHSGEDWTCFPSIGAIMDFTDYSRPAVERNLTLLWREGYISRKRRRRLDGKLGIYDYTLHRDAELRALLKAAREAVEDIETAMETGGQPDVEMTCGPPIISAPAIRQNDGWFPSEPYVKMMGQEPLLEPSREPSTASAREPGDDGFEEAIAAWPLTGRKRTRWAKARAAWAWACSQIEPSALTVAVAACAADPDMASGDFGWPGFDVWLLDERWRAFLPKAADRPGRRTAFVGPPELRAEVEALDPNAAVLLDKAQWLDGAVRAPTSWAWRRLSEPTLAAIITRHGFDLIEPGGAASGGSA